jgi:hypothetical protein
MRPMRRSRAWVGTRGTRGTREDSPLRTLRRLGAGRSQVQILSPRFDESPAETGLSFL